MFNFEEKEINDLALLREEIHNSKVLQIMVFIIIAVKAPILLKFGSFL